MVAEAGAQRAAVRARVGAGGAVRVGGRRRRGHPSRAILVLPLPVVAASVAAAVAAGSRRAEVVGRALPPGPVALVDGAQPVGVAVARSLRCAIDVVQGRPGAGALRVGAGAGHWHGGPVVGRAVHGGGAEQGLLAGDGRARGGSGLLDHGDEERGI